MRFYACFLVLALGLSVFIYDAEVQSAQEEWIDLRADTILYYFPTPDSIAVTAKFTILSSSAEAMVNMSDIGFFLDGIEVEYSGFDLLSGGNDCWGKTGDDCRGDCEAVIHGQAVSGECMWWKDPQDTLFAECICSAELLRFGHFAYAGEAVVSFELDLLGGVAELDETNNYFQLPIGTIANSGSSWGRIKRLER